MLEVKVFSCDSGTSPQPLKPIINGHNDVVVLHHFTPLDGGLELSVLRRNLAGPMQFRCCSIGLDAESAKLAQNKLVRCVLLDWKENTNKLLAPQAITFVAELPAHDQQRFSTPPLPSGFSIMSINPETNKPEFTLTMRKKWSRCCASFQGRMGQSVRALCRPCGR